MVVGRVVARNKVAADFVTCMVQVRGSVSSAVSFLGLVIGIWADYESTMVVTCESNKMAVC
jgi:hypothetical protein